VEQLMQENLARILLVVISCVVACLICEIGYRIVLNRDEEARWQPTSSFAVYSDSVYEFDAETGYKYRPNSRVTLTFIQDGVPRRCDSFETNEYGTPGAGIGSAQIKTLKLIVIGDSFTSKVQNDVTWPDILGHLMQTPILNMAHDGYGVLQMFDQAAQLVRLGYRPKAILITFTGSALSQARFWRMTLVRDGVTNVFTSAIPSVDVKPESHVRTTFIDSRATRTWCEASAASRNADQTAHDIVQSFDATRRADEAFFGHRLRLFSLTDCYLCNLVLYGEPLKSITPISVNPLHTLTRFDDDPQFVRAASTIRDSGVPIWLVYVPYAPELSRGQKVLTKQQYLLLENLKTHADRYIDLTPVWPMGDSVLPLTMLPVDVHPSYAGLQYYATTLHQALIDLRLVN
jgi:hypothetical protein